MPWTMTPKESAGAYDQHPNFILVPDDVQADLRERRDVRQRLEGQKRQELINTWYDHLSDWQDGAPDSLNRVNQETALAALEALLADIPLHSFDDVRDYVTLAESSLQAGRTYSPSLANVMGRCEAAVRRGRV